jgi:hypothetical protein
MELGAWGGRRRSEERYQRLEVSGQSKKERAEVGRQGSKVGKRKKQHKLSV